MSISQDTHILIVTPNASSALGGEAFLPLIYFKLMRQRGCSVQMISHDRNRANLIDVLGKDVQHVHFIADTLWHRSIWRTGRYFPAPLRNSIFGTAIHLVNELYIGKLVRRLVSEGKVNLIHQPIPVSPKAPSSIYGFGVPVVIGPMNGGMTYPPEYENLESVISRRFTAAARIAALAINYIIPGKRNAAALLVANDRTRASLPVVDHPRVITLVENGVDLSIWRAEFADEVFQRSRSADAPFQLVFIGRLVALKAVDITLQALQLARAGGIDARLSILGDGEELEPLMALVERLGLNEAVQFHGFLSQPECVQVLARADALILNSVHECGGAVVLEAMGLGLPVIASNWGGPTDYLDPSCGILVPPSPRADFAANLAKAIERLANDPALSRAMGKSGRQKVEEHFDWEKKIDRMLAIYDEVLSEAAMFSD